MKNEKRKTKSSSKVIIYGDEFFAENGRDIKDILKDLILREIRAGNLSRHES